MDVEKLTAYQLIERHHSEDVKSEAYLLEHKKSGARIAVLENEDENKVFYIGFRTPPKDSTGVAHIIEHSVLCGSEAFPLKDPFVELVKGSLNTFLNAMTYPDKTVYPVASCNHQDFRNLMHVYMDAVLHPNIYQEEKIFRQEGWHYELDAPEGELTINGVVYNEMKGAFSSPDDVLAREMMNQLFPDTAYGVESGGDPQVIPELTYEAFLDFHRRYYHPSNSYIYLYGDADMEERLRWLDEAYLSQYDRIALESHPGEQEPFDAPRYAEKEYPITEEMPEENSSYLTYNVVIGKTDDALLTTAFDMIDYALISAEGTPLWKALNDAGIGTEIYASYESGIYQPYYSIVAKNAGARDEERFVTIIEDTLKRIVEEGIDENALLACLNSMEFRYREADSGQTPKGLIYGLKMFDSWLYDDRQAFDALERLEVFSRLRERIGSDYFTALIRERLIENPHKAILRLVPKRGLTAARDQALAKRLASYKASLSREEVEAIIQSTKALKEYQATPDTPEQLRCLPTLSVSDIDRKAAPLYNEWTEIDGIRTLFHEIETNGILYLNLLFDTSRLPLRLFPYLGLLKLVLTSVDTAQHSYEQLGYELDKYTGAFSINPSGFFPGERLENFRMNFMVQASFLADNTAPALSLLREILLDSKLEDTARIREIIAEGRSRLQGNMLAAGHMVSITRASAQLSEAGWTKEQLAGLDFYHFLEDAEQNFDARAEAIVTGLRESALWVLQKEHLLLDVTGTRDMLAMLRGNIQPITEALPVCRLEEPRGELKLERKNEGYTTPGQVQFVARVGNYQAHGLEYRPALRVLKTILGYDYLWNEVRVKGGAYGCMNSAGTNGYSYFVSYRDPHLKHTLEIFENIPAYIRAFDADETAMQRYLIGTMSGLDVPLTPRAKGVRSLQYALEGVSYETLQRRREELLSTTAADIRALAEYVEAILSDSALCVVGNEEKVRAAKEEFDDVRSLF